MDNGYLVAMKLPERNICGWKWNYRQIMLSVYKKRNMLATHRARVVAGSKMAIKKTPKLRTM